VSLSLSQLIVACGDDKVQFQNLDQCATSIDYTAKSGWRITFGTELPIGHGAGMATEKLGLVVWLDRADVAAAIAHTKPEEAAA
jgi:hypothetical protein